MGVEMVRVSEKTLVKITAIVSLTVLEIVNLAFFGYDGTILALIIAVISGLAGYTVGRRGESG